MFANVSKGVLGFASGTLGAALVAVGIFAALQSYRLDNTRALLASAETQVGLLTDRVRDDAAKLVERDRLIAEQNAAVASWKAKAEQDRADYRKRLKEADRAAAGHYDRAATILQSTSQVQEDRAAAALGLILSTVNPR